MNRHIKVLDCTLRDGGYINDFRFGHKNATNIVTGLAEASIDIIECGFLQSDSMAGETTLFPSISSISNVLEEKKKSVMYVAMIQYGRIGIDEIADCDDSSVDGIRLTFHEHEIEDALMFCEQLKDKGYSVFIQPVGTVTYSDETILRIIKRVNEIRPYAFYIVDTLGSMYKRDLLRLFYLVDNNLNSRIALGFHSHNNLQLAFSNAQEFMQLNTKRQLIIDSTLFGMGRGAGNLCTELIVQYINDNVALRYNTVQILELIDRYIKPLRSQYTWGYDASYYIASINNCHPNYSHYLLNLQTLHIEDIYAIINSMDSKKRAVYDRKYIERCYLEYMKHHVDDSAVLKKISKLIAGKKVIVIAPGKSAIYTPQILDERFDRSECYVISINFTPAGIPLDMVFISNMKRYSNLADVEGADNVVITSNITIKQDYKFDVIDYSSYLSEEQNVADNAGLMCLNFVLKLGAREIYLFGFDGFSSSTEDNYYDESMLMDVDMDRRRDMNESFSRKLEQLRTRAHIEFVTQSLYE